MSSPRTRRHESEGVTGQQRKINNSLSKRNELLKTKQQQQTQNFHNGCCWLVGWLDRCCCFDFDPITNNSQRKETMFIFFLCIFCKKPDQGRYIYQCDNFNLKPDVERKRSEETGSERETNLNEGKFHFTSSGVEPSQENHLRLSIISSIGQWWWW